MEGEEDLGSSAYGTHWGIWNCTSTITLYQPFSQMDRQVVWCLYADSIYYTQIDPNFPCSLQYHDLILDPYADIIEFEWSRFHNYDSRQNLRPWAGNRLVSGYTLPIAVTPNNIPESNDFTTEPPKMFNSTHRFHILSPSPMAAEFTINHLSSKNLHAAADHVLLFDRSPPSVHHDHHAPSLRPEVSP